MVAPLTPQMNITRAVIIALNTLDVTLLQKNIRLHITQRVDIFQAINGSQAMALSQETLPLYTRYLIDHGRQNHMQIGNAAMLACLLSHIEIWKTITPGETVGVFEEDAQIDAVSASRLWWFQQDMHGLSWDILKLDSGQLIDSGKYKYVGTGMAATCANGESCLRWGTRGYLLRYNTHSCYSTSPHTQSFRSTHSSASWPHTNHTSLNSTGQQLTLHRPQIGACPKYGTDAFGSASCKNGSSPFSVYPHLHSHYSSLLNSFQRITHTDGEMSPDDYLGAEADSNSSMACRTRSWSFST